MVFSRHREELLIAFTALVSVECVLSTTCAQKLRCEHEVVPSQQVSAAIDVAIVADELSRSGATI